MTTFGFAKCVRLGVCGLLFLVAIFFTPCASAQLRSYCWVGETSASNPYNSDGKPVYFTAMVATTRDGIRGGLFVQYVEKKYGVERHGAAYCTGGTDLNNVVPRKMEEEIARAKSQGSTVVMTGWTPDKHEALMAELAKNPPPAAATAPAKNPPPPSTAESAYEKAMQAERPQSANQPQATASAKAPGTAKPATTAAPPTSTAGERYIFCYSTGSPPRGPGQSHYYVTQVFPAPATSSHPYDAFTAYLKGQHRQEAISGTTCSTPGRKDAEESTRQGYIKNQQKFPNRAIVEMNWQPTS